MFGISKPESHGKIIVSPYTFVTWVEHIVTERGKVVSHMWDVIPNDLPQDKKDARILRVIRGEIE